MATKKSKGSPWKNRLSEMSPEAREAYKLADNARVKAYRAQKKAERDARSAGEPSPVPEKIPTRPEFPRGAPRPVAISDVADVPEASRALFTQYVGLACKPTWNLAPFSQDFHRSDFMEMGLRPTDDVRDVPDVPFSVGKRLHTQARLYRATNEERYVFLGVDARAEEAATSFVATMDRRAIREAATTTETETPRRKARG